MVITMSRGSRTLLAMWVLWLTSTVYTYLSGMVLPMQLPGDVIVPDWVWVTMWALPLGCFVLSVAFPSHIVSWLSAGFSITAALCGAWTTALLMRWASGAAEHAGTSAKNYAFFMLVAIWSGWFITRDAKLREVIDDG